MRVNRDDGYHGFRVDTTRLPGWDYATTAWYFVTICTADGACHFGRVHDGAVKLSHVGRVAYENWSEIPHHFAGVRTDAFVVMPNHLHGILAFEATAGETRHVASLQGTKRSNEFGPLKPRSLQSVVHAYKGAVTRWCRRNNHDEFRWQPRFYDHLVRGEQALDEIRHYVVENPVKWELDEYDAKL